MSNNANNIGLLDPVDDQPIVTPGQIVGGDTIYLLSTCPKYESASPDYVNELIGLVQGISIQSGRMIRAVYQIGQKTPVLISSMGQKSLNMSSIITEETNIIAALYKSMLNTNNIAILLSTLQISVTQANILNRYMNKPILEGMSKDLLRIPFGLLLHFASGEGESIQTVHLGDCMLAGIDEVIEAGTRGIPETTAIMWQKTTHIPPNE